MPEEPMEEDDGGITADAPIPGENYLSDTAIILCTP